MRNFTRIALLSSFVSALYMYASGTTGLLTWVWLLPAWGLVLADDFIGAYRERTGVIKERDSSSLED